MPFNTDNAVLELRNKARDMFPFDETLARSTYHWMAADEIERLRTALDDIANGHISVTDSMLESREAMMSALANYCQERARTALLP